MSMPELVIKTTFYFDISFGLKLNSVDLNYHGTYLSW